MENNRNTAEGFLSQKDIKDLIVLIYMEQM
jgi:hypothetical protein